MSLPVAFSMRGHWKARRLLVKVLIIGLGYVGLPLAQEAVRVGLRVTGLDVKQATVDALKSGRTRRDDRTDAGVAAMVACGFRAVAAVPDVAAVVGEQGPDVIVICVPT